MKLAESTHFCTIIFEVHETTGMYNDILLRGLLFFCTYFFYFFAPWSVRRVFPGAGVKSNL